jgi:P4 family phage/plasmid primase-like protien
MYEFNEDHASKFYSLLRHRQSEYTELRTIDPHTRGGPLDRAWVNNLADFLSYCRKWNGKGHVYAGINPRIQMGHGKNEHIKRITLIPIDIDAEKPKDKAANKEALAKAYDDAQLILKWFKEQNFNTPYLDMSGNGYHVLIQTNIKIDDSSFSSKVDTFYHQLPVQVDPATKDPARVIKVPGTWSLKGNNTSDRPYRQAYIIHEGETGIDNLFQQWITDLQHESQTIPNKPVTITMSSLHQRLSYALQNKKIKDLYDGLYQKHDPSGQWTRSEAEFALVLEFLHNNISAEEISSVMDECKIGKWRDETSQYKDYTIRKAWKYYQENPWRFFRNKKYFVPSWVANEILSENYVVALRDTKEIYIYNQERGIYISEGESNIQEAVKKKLQDLSNSHRINEVIKDVTVRTYVSRTKLGVPDNLLILKNGVYNLETDILMPHSPDYMATSSIPIEYIQNATCPKITQFLGEVLRPEDFDLMIELIGYCLFRGHPIARIFVLTGVGRNGKSRLLTLISRFLGKNNVSSLTLQEIAQDRFAKAQLYNKLANVAADIPATPIKYTGDIKALTGEDSVSAQHKFQSRFEFINYAKLLFSANEIPATYDNTLAFFRRMMLIHFPNSFPANDPKTDPNIVEKITTPDEFSGLLNLALAGLKRLLDQGFFTGEKSVEERQDDYVRKSNPIQYFALHYVEQAESVQIIVKKEELYKSYVQLCNALNQRPRASNTFSNQVKRFLPYIDEGSRDIPDGSKKKKKTTKTRVWFGIRIKKEILTKFIESQRKGTIDTVDTMSGTLSSTTQEEQTPITSKVTETVSIVSTVPEEEPNIAHLKRIARQLVQRFGPMKLSIFYNSMEEAGHHQSIVDSIMRRDSELEFTLSTVEWRGDDYSN